MSDLLRIQDKSTIHAGEHDAYWSLPSDDLFRRLDSSPHGLNSDQAQRRLKALGPANLKPRHQYSAVYLLLHQFKDPLVLILLFAVCVSVTVGEWVDAAVVTVVIAGTAILSFTQEYNATKAVEELMARVQARATVLYGILTSTTKNSADIVPFHHKIYSSSVDWAQRHNVDCTFFGRTPKTIRQYMCYDSTERRRVCTPPSAFFAAAGRFAPLLGGSVQPLKIRRGVGMLAREIGFLRMRVSLPAGASVKA